MAHAPPYPDAVERPATKVIYSQLISSRAREESDGTISTSTPSAYTYRFGEEIRGVTTVQLGDFTIDQSGDPRLPFDQSRRHFQIQQPLHLTLSTGVAIEEINEYFIVGGSLTGEVSASITTTTGATLTLPPTFNTVSATDDSSGVNVSITTSVDHELDSVIDFWPMQAGPARVVATRINNGDPEFRADTTTIIDGTNVTLPASYISSTFTTAAAGAAAAILNGFVFVPRLTVPEYCEVIDEKLGELQDLGSLSARYRCRFNTLSGGVEFYGETGLSESPFPGVRIDRKVRLTVGAGDVFNRIGFPSGTYFGPFLKNQTKLGDGQYISTEPSVSVWLPQDARTVELPQASYTDVASLVEVLQDTTNPLYFDETLTAEERTLKVELPGTTVTSVIFDAGWYEPQLFADNASERLQSLSANMTVTYNSLTGGFKFANTIGSSFNLDFRTSPIMARELGFETDEYTGLSSYTSSQRAVSA